MVVSATQLPAYDHAKGELKEYFHMKDGVALHFSASLCAGLFNCNSIQFN